MLYLKIVHLSLVFQPNISNWYKHYVYFICLCIYEVAHKNAINKINWYSSHIDNCISIVLVLTIQVTEYALVFLIVKRFMVRKNIYSFLFTEGTWRCGSSKFGASACPWKGTTQGQSRAFQSRERCAKCLREYGGCRGNSTDSDWGYWRISQEKSSWNHITFWTSPYCQRQRCETVYFSAILFKTLQVCSKIFGDEQS